MEFFWEGSAPPACAAVLFTISIHHKLHSCEFASLSCRPTVHCPLPTPAARGHDSHHLDSSGIFHDDLFQPTHQSVLGSSQTCTAPLRNAPEHYKEILRITATIPTTLLTCPRTLCTLCPPSYHLLLCHQHGFLTLKQLGRGRMALG